MVIMEIIHCNNGVMERHHYYFLIRKSRRKDEARIERKMGGQETNIRVKDFDILLGVSLVRVSK
jgi:hypothetical protein